MDLDQGIVVLTAVTDLVKAVAWPLIALFIVLRFAPQLIGLIGSGRDVTIKALGVEATFTNSMAEAAAALTAAEAKAAEANLPEAGDGTGSGESSQVGTPPPRTAVMPSPASMARKVTTWVPDVRAQQEIEGAVVLWVDDNPDNNRFEREALQAVGVRFELSTSTQDALDLLGRRQFDAVISDMGRGREHQAGYQLLERLRQTDRTTPFFIYAGSSAVRHRAEALARGAQGSTDSPHELMALVIQAIRERHKG